MHGSQIDFSHWFLNNFGKKAANKAVKTAGEEYEKQLKEYEAAVKKQQEEEKNDEEEEEDVHGILLTEDNDRAFEGDSHTGAWL